MKRHLLIPLMAMLLLASCNSKTILDETHTFDRTVWNRFTPEDFTIDVPNADDYYNITLEAVVDTTLMRGDGLPLLVKLESPNGDRRTFQSGITLRQNGRWRGEPADGTYRLINEKIKAYFSFNAKGANLMHIQQATSQYDMAGIRSLRVVVEKIKLDYPE